MNISEAFGVILKKHRNNLNISQEQLADKCDLDRTFISLLERGKRNPTIETLFKVSIALETLPSEVIKEIEQLLNNIA